MRDKMNIEEIKSIGEGQYFDRKSAKIQINKLVEAIIAFANADGGTIAIGVEDGKIVGINSQGNIKINDFIQCSFDKCIPPVKVSHEFIGIKKENGNEDRLLMINVEPSMDRIHKTKADEVYLRVGDENKKLNFEQRLNLEYDKGERLFEDKVISECTMEDLDVAVLKNYAEVLKYKSDDYERLLYARGLARRSKEGPQVTVAGVLLFAENPSIFLPNARIRFFRYEGSSAEVGVEMNIIKQEMIEGPLPKQIERVKNIVKAQLREFTALNPLNGKFMSIPEYPEFAWQEGIINAITHRAYNIQGDDIKIFMYDDRLEIVSPGKFPNIVSKDNIKEVRYSRNPRIARALTELGWVRELGEGVKRIYKEMKEYFLDEPIYNEPNYSVSLVLKNNIVTRRQRRTERVNDLIGLDWEGFTEDEKKAIEIAYLKEKLYTKEFADIVKRSTTYARSLLNRLVDKGILKKVAASKTDPHQYYVFVDIGR
jgi:ATP-dependent DNA helicase RecG